MPDTPYQGRFVGSSFSLPVAASAESEPQVQEVVRPTLGSLFLVWSKISIQSFGGGSSTLLLMRREFVEKQRWLTAEEYTRFWSLSQLSPGIILVGMSLLMGRRLAGTGGMIVSLVGILLPSAAITTLLTAGFALIQTLHLMQAMIQGVLPATAGIMLALSIQFAYPLARQSTKYGPVRCIECLVVIVGSALALAFFHLEVSIVLLVAAFVCVAIFLPLDTFCTSRRVRRKDEK